MTTGLFADPRRLPPPARAAALRLVAELCHAAAGRHTGILRITGDPGGEVHLRCGRVVAVRSPAAPGIPELLARSGTTGLGDAQIRAVALMAALDAAFAITAGWIEDCRWPAESDCAATPDWPVDVEPVRLLTETERRVRAIADAGFSPLRDRLTVTPHGTARLALIDCSDPQQILRQVDGRRSCRDIALQLNRGLFAVTATVSRLLAESKLAIPPRSHVNDDGPRGAATVLPRRHPGSSGINDLLPPRPARATLPHLAPDLVAALAPARTSRRGSVIHDKSEPARAPSFRGKRKPERVR